jgi:ORF6N domain
MIPKKTAMDSMELVAQVEQSVHSFRNQRVVLSHDLAEFYGIETKVLMQAVRRNRERFPADFAFILDKQELANLRSQFVTSSWGGTRYAPMAFTELGVAMLSSVIKSEQAIAVNIEIMRAFVRMRGILSEHKDLKRSLNALERKYDDQFRIVFDAIRELMTPPAEPKKRPIGFIQDMPKDSKSAPKAKKK